MADEKIHVEALVIGAGPGGYVAGIRLGQLKRRRWWSSATSRAASA
jgi:pyruvate/2-oxoglutarate dehydrogenase complex dihydrolipoamide dehydrogenase (E3) component